MNDDRDNELFAAWRRGNKKAGDALFMRHFDDLNGFFHNKVGEAVDLLQQTWAKLVQNADNLTGKSFRGYLFGIARHVLMDHLRLKYRRGLGHVTPDDLPEPSLEDLGVSPLAAMAERQRGGLIRKSAPQDPAGYPGAL